MSYRTQHHTGFRAYAFALATVFAPGPDEAHEFAAALGLLDLNARAQLALDLEAANVAARHEREHGGEIALCADCSWPYERLRLRSERLAVGDVPSLRAERWGGMSEVDGSRGMFVRLGSRIDRIARQM